MLLVVPMSTFTIDRFVARNGKTYALGTLNGKIAQRTVHRSNVAIPPSIGGANGGARDAAALSCQILHLVLPWRRAEGCHSSQTKLLSMANGADAV